MNAASAEQGWCIVVASASFTLACVIAACIRAGWFQVAPAAAQNPESGTARAPIRLTAADFLAAPVHEDTATLILPLQWWAAWKERDPVQAYGWRAREQQREYWAIKDAIRARESGRRIGQAIRFRNIAAAQADLRAAIRASYAELNLDDKWDDLVAAIRAPVTGSLSAICGTP